MSSEHAVTSPEITFMAEHESGTGKIWKTFWILSALTVIELGLGYWIYGMHKEAAPSASLILAVKGTICILTLAKAFYIVSIFMHLGDEIRNFIMTIIVPLSLFIWFLTAFLIDGTSWKNLRTRYMGKHDTEQVVPAAATEKGAKD